MSNRLPLHLRPKTSKKANNKRNHGRGSSQPGKIPRSTCDSCGKQAFVSKSDARSYSKTVHPGDKFSFYPCQGIPTNWHYGHLDASVKDGRRDRHELGYTAPRNVDRSKIHVNEREPRTLKKTKPTKMPTPRILDDRYKNAQ